MEPDRRTSRFDATPEFALSAIASHRGTVLVDLDETLYLRNSTADFIGHACPAVMAFMLMKVLDMLSPWRLTGGPSTRDNWRVIVLWVAMPWTLWTWRRAARRLASDWTNRPLRDAMSATAEPKAIVTLGFGPVVAPLVQAMGLGGIRVISMRAWHFGDRRSGKRAVVAGALGSEACSRALLVTDSLDDLDLLEACAQPLQVVWPDALYREPFCDTYIPGLYIARVKRPGMQYIQRAIVRDDFMLWILATVAIATGPILVHLGALALLALSFWAIYETGYVDNDRIAARHEKAPNLTEAYFRNLVKTSEVLPWVWAGVAGAIGITLLRWPGVPFAADFAAWAAVLAVTYGSFRLYNRVDKQSRIWLFGVLQMLRAAAIVAVAPVTLVGAIGLTAHGLARWVPYYLFRSTGGAWRNDASAPTRLLFFVLLIVVHAMAFGWTIAGSFTAVAIFAWFVFKARHELVSIVRGAHWIADDMAASTEVPTTGATTGQREEPKKSPLEQGAK
jgi:hypothetical protein